MRERLARTAGKRWLRLASVLVAFGAAFFFGSALWRNADVLTSMTWDAGAWISMLGSVLLLTVANLIGGGVWALILRGTGERLPLRQAVAIVAVAQFAKYMPGNVAHHVGRVMLARMAGLAVPVVVQSVVFETLWALASATLVCVFATWAVVCEGACLQGVLPIPLPGLFGLAALLALGPSAMLSLLARVWPAVLVSVGLGAAHCRPRWPTAIGVQLLYGAAFFLAGAALYWQSQILFSASAMTLTVAVGAFAAAWVAGYLVIGAPAGLGVREATLLVLLTPLMGEPVAVALGLTLRLCSTLSDLLTLIVGWYLRRVRPVVA